MQGLKLSVNLDILRILKVKVIIIIFNKVLQGFIIIIIYYI
jgi:hypothetical protein